MNRDHYLSKRIPSPSPQLRDRRTVTEKKPEVGNAAVPPIEPPESLTRSELGTERQETPPGK